MSSLQYKVDINPSYEWAEEAEELNISHRELEVFALVTEGYSNKETAQILKVKHQSVKNHMHSLSKKLGVKNNTQALVIAVHLNLIKVRMKTPYKEVPVMDYTAERVLDDLRKIVAGELDPNGWPAKERRWLRVFLKEHGIDPEDW